MEKKTLGNYQIMITSKYFERIDDFINLEIAVKRFNGNMERFHFNPIPLNEITRKFFPNLETYHLYSFHDQYLIGGRIFKYCIWYKVNYQTYLYEKEKGNDCKLICYTQNDSQKYGNEIPKEVKIIENYYYQIIKKLNSITIPYSIIELGCWCLNGCNKLESIEMISVKTFRDCCLCDCSSLTSVTFSDSILSLGNGCFKNCTSLKSIVIPNSLIEIGIGCFENCSSLVSIEIPNSVTKICAGCFANCSSLTSVIIPNSLSSITNKCFRNCSSLSSIEIPNSIKEIGISCFENCTSLKSVVIPNSITKMRNWCFKNCSSLSLVIIQFSSIQFGGNCFYNCPIVTSSNMPYHLKKLNLIDEFV